LGGPKPKNRSDHDVESAPLTRMQIVSSGDVEMLVLRPVR
jgi:hypothetical protein